MANTTAIQLTQLTKIFGTFVANDHIDMTIRYGEVHALLGENGAGKTTLMNMLSGIYQPTSGAIEVGGKPVKLNSAKDATRLGIGMVHQHFMLVQNFTVLENIILGDEPLRHGQLNRKQAHERIVALSEQYGLQVDPDARVDEISVGMQQRVEILKVLYRDADILIFDEPTAVLTPQEVAELLAIFQRLADEDKAVILISHKLQELKAVAAVTTVIRRGKVVATVEMANTTTVELAELMVGRPIDLTQHHETMPEGPVLLALDHVTVLDHNKRPRVNDVSLELRGGEIVGLAGIDGNGQSELVRAITGLSPVASGQIHINGNDMTNASVRQIIHEGVGHIPEDRQKDGLILPMTLIDNMHLQTYHLAPFANHGYLNQKAMIDDSEKLVEQFDIRTTSVWQHAGELSGGNQQKLIIARELSRNPGVLIAVNPTRGLDVGAIEFVHRQIMAARSAGHAVLLISYELDEIRQLSDRIAVIHQGQLVGGARVDEVTVQEIGLMMAGERIADKEVTHAN